MAKLTKIAETVKSILIQHPETRDNDRLLTLKVWAIEEASLRDDSYSFKTFARRFLNNQFSDTESIRRSRQKLQEENTNLRGPGYRTRQGKYQREFKEQLNRIKT